MSAARISVEEADRILAESCPLFPAHHVPLTEAEYAVLREDVHTDHPLPPYHRVTMDGIALVACGSRRFTVEATQYAGQPPLTLNDPAAGCIQIMTGAVLPEGCDCVIPIEEITIEDGVAVLHDEAAPEPWLFVHRRGTDRAEGDLVLSSGCVLRGPEMAILASVGRAEVRVGQPPDAAVISSGDELVEPGRPVLPHQVRRSNSYALVAMLHRAGLPDVAMHHLQDDRASMERTLSTVLDTSGVVVLSGGVSAGKRDFVPGVLANLGVEARFHRVRQRPGGPFWFGTRPGGPLVFALPGNPVSAITCCRRYVVPQLLRCLGAADRAEECVILGEDISFKTPLAHFPPVKLESASNGVRQAMRVNYQGSGDLSSLAASNGFVELDAGQDQFAKGTLVPYYEWM